MHIIYIHVGKTLRDTKSNTDKDHICTVWIACNKVTVFASIFIRY